VTQLLERRSSPADAYYRQIWALPVLSADEERDLADRARAGDRAAGDRLVQAHLRLVVAVARRYVGRGLSLADLVEEGNVGLLKAVPRFDPTYGVRFGVYATFWIKQAIRRALLTTTRTIHVPVNTTVLLNRFGKAANLLQRELGRTPRPDEVARRLCLSEKKLDLLRQAIRVRDSAVWTDRDGQDGARLEDTLADHRSEGPEQELLRTEALNRLRSQLSRLEEREATVLRLRYGLADGGPKTLQEVGDHLGITREGVRKIESKALGKLSERMRPVELE
jgi:RNA polymerase primary sigma factor